MMFSEKFVVAIKHNGKVLREFGDLVKIPFGSEFSVLVKNLNSRRAKFTLQIDGQDVLDNQEIIVNANSEVEMKRFIRNGNMDEGNAFKFIERTAAIEDGPRGIKVDDGVVRVEFWFEKEVPETKTTYHRDVWWDEHYRTYPRTYLRDYYGGPFYGSLSSTSGDSRLMNATLGSITKGMSSSASAGSNVRSMNATFSANAASSETVASYNATSTDSVVPQADVTVTNDVGITVPGSKVEQKFHAVYGFNSEVHSNVIIIRLAGKAGAINIVAPVTVKTKNICSTCSHTNKHNAKFCSQCGTSLNLV